MSNSFTRDRARLSSDYFADEDSRYAYIALFLLTNAKKVCHLLEQHQDLFPKSKTINILDIGAGPGTALLAASSFLAKTRPDLGVRFVAVDSSSTMFKTAKELAKNILPENHEIDWVVGDMSKLRKTLGDLKFDLAIAANSLNEIPQDMRARVCSQALNASDNMIIVDPALKNTSRKLMALRDKLLTEEGALVLAPCTHQHDCHMLKANERDWCHFYIEWKRPRLIEMIDHATGLDHRYLKLSYLALSKAEHPALSASWCVVSSPLSSKGKVELVLCGNGALKRIRRLNRNASSENEGFARARRGDLVTFEDKDRPGEIRAHDKFKILKSFL
jgi:ribosomal protein RSM22 (predicted rRNA methylase)